MAELGAFAAKTRLSELLKRVSEGEQITITKHGTPIAILSPAQPQRRRPCSELITSLKAFRKRHRLGGTKLKEMIEAGRR